MNCHVLVDRRVIVNALAMATTIRPKLFMDAERDNGRAAWPLVDIYNSASLKYGLPVGAEDIETFEGNLVLGVTAGNDEFYALGDTENSPTLDGEVCYRDDKGAVCRCFNWRDGQRTMITENTEKAFVVIEYVNSERNEDIEKALKMIAEYSEKELGAKIAALKLLTKNEDTIELI